MRGSKVRNGIRRQNSPGLRRGDPANSSNGFVAKDRFVASGQDIANTPRQLGSGIEQAFVVTSAVFGNVPSTLRLASSSALQHQVEELQLPSEEVTMLPTIPSSPLSMLVGSSLQTSEHEEVSEKLPGYVIKTMHSPPSKCFRNTQGLDTSGQLEDVRATCSSGSGDNASEIVRPYSADENSRRSASMVLPASRQMRGASESEGTSTFNAVNVENVILESEGNFTKTSVTQNRSRRKEANEVGRDLASTTDVSLSSSCNGAFTSPNDNGKEATLQRSRTQSRCQMPVSRTTSVSSEECWSPRSAHAMQKRRKRPVHAKTTPAKFWEEYDNSTEDVASPSDFEHLKHHLTGGRSPCFISQAEHRGITVNQLQVLLSFIRKRFDEDWLPLRGTSYQGFNLYNVNEKIIQPLTLGDKCSYVETVATDPQKQTPKWFISHWWGEPLVEFLKCIENHVRVRELCDADDTSYWICAYANNQHELGMDIGKDPRSSSFFRALRLTVGVLLLLNEAGPQGPATPFRRIWCCFELSTVALSLGAEEELLLDIAATCDGRAELLTHGFTSAEESMEKLHLANPNQPSGWVSKSRREASFPLWATQLALEIDIVQAKASIPDDRIRILNALLGRVGDDLDASLEEDNDLYTQINQTLRGVFAVATMRQKIERRLRFLPHDYQEPCQSSSRRFRASVDPLSGDMLLMKALSEDGKRKVLDVNMSRCQALKDADVKILMKACPEQLECIDFSFEGCSQLSNDVLLFISQGLSRLSRLVKIRLIFRECKTLTVLDDFLAGRVLNLDFLKSLTLNFQGCANLHAASALQLFTACGGYHNLTRLEINLAYCWQFITLDYVGDELAKLQALAFLVLNLRGCSSLHSIRGLGEGISKLRNLSSLLLDFKECAKLESMDDLAQGISNMGRTHLLHLNFGGCTRLQSLGGLAQALQQSSGLCRKNAAIKLWLQDCPALSAWEVSCLEEAVSSLWTWNCMIKIEGAGPDGRPWERLRRIEDHDLISAC